MHRILQHSIRLVLMIRLCKSYDIQKTRDHLNQRVKEHWHAKNWKQDNFLPASVCLQGKESVADFFFGSQKGEKRRPSVGREFQAEFIVAVSCFRTTYFSRADTGSC